MYIVTKDSYTVKDQALMEKIRDNDIQSIQYIYKCIIREEANLDSLCDLLVDTHIKNLLKVCSQDSFESYLRSLTSHITKTITTEIDLVSFLDKLLHLSPMTHHSRTLGIYISNETLHIIHSLNLSGDLEPYTERTHIALLSFAGYISGHVSLDSFSLYLYLFPNNLKYTLDGLNTLGIGGDRGTSESLSLTVHSKKGDTYYSGNLIDAVMGILPNVHHLLFSKIPNLNRTSFHRMTRNKLMANIDSITLSNLDVSSHILISLFTNVLFANRTLRSISIVDCPLVYEYYPSSNAQSLYHKIFNHPQIPSAFKVEHFTFCGEYLDVQTVFELISSTKFLVNHINCLHLDTFQEITSKHLSLIKETCPFSIYNWGEEVFSPGTKKAT